MPLPRLVAQCNFWNRTNMATTLSRLTAELKHRKASALALGDTQRAERLDLAETLARLYDRYEVNTHEEDDDTDDRFDRYQDN